MKSILFAGGDNRSIIAFNELKRCGFQANSIGLFDNDDGGFENAEAIVLPVPSTKDGKTVFCPLTGRKIFLSEIEKRSAGKLVITANYSFGENCVDILKGDDFAILNAVPTAEGAISFAIQNTPFTLWRSRVLVIGNGRVAKVLINRLSAFCCRLTVSARKQKDFALLDTQNIEFIDTADAAKKASGFDIIFNTVDAPLFPCVKVLDRAFLIDLSSKGCIDFEKAKSEGVKAVKLPAVPTATAPETAGAIYARTLKAVIDSQN
jgi:dipicolinate synthase subunit A